MTYGIGIDPAVAGGKLTEGQPCGCGELVQAVRVVFLLGETPKRTITCLSCQEKIDGDAKEKLKSIPSHHRPVPAHLISALAVNGEIKHHSVQP